MGQAHRGCSKASGASLRSDRTVHRYIGDLARAAEFVEQQFGVGRLARISHQQAQHYIDSRRAEGLHAATVQGYAKALETLPRVGRLSVPSRRIERRAQHGRAYTDDQVRLVQNLLPPSAQLATAVLLESGCRVADLASLCPAAERSLRNARVERLLPNRFLGRDDWPRFTFIGKGGHEYMSCVRPETAARLAAICLEVPRAFYDRNVEHATVQRFDLPAGNRLSQQWTRASQCALGYSHGIHGLRHSFAQDRVQELIVSGIPWTIALECTRQLMGHYRPEEIHTYLR
jgi:integrase